MGGDLVDRAGGVGAHQGAVGAHFRGLVLARALQHRAGRKQSALDHPAERHARLGALGFRHREDFGIGGIDLGDYRTLPCRARLLEPAPSVPPRDPPIRFRKNVPDAWLALELTEGKNRQVRRMTAAVGHPTLRLLRARIGNCTLGGRAAGKWRELGAEERAAIFGG